MCCSCMLGCSLGAVLGMGGVLLSMPGLLDGCCVLDHADTNLRAYARSMGLRPMKFLISPQRRG